MTLSSCLGSLRFGHTKTYCECHTHVQRSSYAGNGHQRNAGWSSSSNPRCHLYSGKNYAANHILACTPWLWATSYHKSRKTLQAYGICKDYSSEDKAKQLYEMKWQQDCSARELCLFDVNNIIADPGSYHTTLALFMGKALHITLDVIHIWRCLTQDLHGALQSWKGLMDALVS